MFDASHSKTATFSPPPTSTATQKSTHVETLHVPRRTCGSSLPREAALRGAPPAIGPRIGERDRQMTPTPAGSTAAPGERRHPVCREKKPSCGNRQQRRQGQLGCHSINPVRTEQSDLIGEPTIERTLVARNVFFLRPAHKIAFISHTVSKRASARRLHTKRMGSRERTAGKIHSQRRGRHHVLSCLPVA